jgi:hypothetical protein
MAAGASKASRARAAERRELVLQAVIAGKTERAIAVDLGIDRSRVHRLKVEALEDLRSRTLEHAEQLRALETARLDLLTEDLMAARFEIVDDKGEPDPRSLRVDIVNTILRVRERYAKLWGLDLKTADEQRVQAFLELALGLMLQSILAGLPVEHHQAVITAVGEARAQLESGSAA